MLRLKCQGAIALSSAAEDSGFHGQDHNVIHSRLATMLLSALQSSQHDCRVPWHGPAACPRHSAVCCMDMFDEADRLCPTCRREDLTLQMLQDPGSSSRGTHSSSLQAFIVQHAAEHPTGVDRLLSRWLPRQNYGPFAVLHASDSPTGNIPLSALWLHRCSSCEHDLQSAWPCTAMPCLCFRSLTRSARLYGQLRHALQSLTVPDKGLQQCHSL